MTTLTYATYDSVTVRRVLFPRAVSHQPAPAYRMFIAPADQPSKGIKIPYAPREITHTVGADYADVARVGRKPALVYQNPKRKEMTFTLLVADKYQAVPGAPTSPRLLFSADAIASTLGGWAIGGVRLRVTYGSFENWTWRITDYSVRSIQRGATTNNQTVAEITMTLSEVQDIKVGVGPVSGGVKPAPSKTTPAPKTNTYTVKRGDTLWSISIKYYGTGTKWRKIADANKIKNANKIRVGQKIKIP